MKNHCAQIVSENFSKQIDYCILALKYIAENDRAKCEVSTKSFRCKYLKNYNNWNNNWNKLSSSSSQNLFYHCFANFRHPNFVFFVGITLYKWNWTCRIILFFSVCLPLSRPARIIIITKFRLIQHANHEGYAFSVISWNYPRHVESNTPAS